VAWLARPITPRLPLQVLDDMEQTGVIPYFNRGNYYNVYSRLYKLLASKAKLLP
jgi:hypothetical protein